MSETNPPFGAPLPMLLFCPLCGMQHVDAPNPERNWTNPPHRSHECQFCGAIWRPSDHHTDGVARLETAGPSDNVTQEEQVQAMRLGRLGSSAIADVVRRYSPLVEDLHRFGLVGFASGRRWLSSDALKAERDKGSR